MGKNLFNHLSSINRCVDGKSLRKKVKTLPLSKAFNSLAEFMKNVVLALFAVSVDIFGR